MSNDVVPILHAIKNGEATTSHELLAQVYRAFDDPENITTPVIVDLAGIACYSTNDDFSRVCCSVTAHGFRNNPFAVTSSVAIFLLDIACRDPFAKVRGRATQILAAAFATNEEAIPDGALEKLVANLDNARARSPIDPMTLKAIGYVLEGGLEGVPPDAMEKLAQKAFKGADKPLALAVLRKAMAHNPRSATRALYEVYFNLASDFEEPSARHALDVLRILLGANPGEEPEDAAEKLVKIATLGKPYGLAGPALDGLEALLLKEPQIATQALVDSLKIFISQTTELNLFEKARQLVGTTINLMRESRRPEKAAPRHGSSDPELL